MADDAYQPTHHRAAWAQVLIGLAGGLHLIVAYTLLQLPGMMERANAGRLTEGDVADYFAWLSNLEQATIIAPVAAAIAFLLWLRRTASNVRPLTGESPQYSPNWSVGWWFVPIAFLFMPFLVVRDLYRRLATDLSQSWIVTVWWIAFAGGAVVVRLGATILETAFTDAELQMAVNIGLVGSLGWAGAALPAIMIIRAVQRGSSNRARHAAVADGAREHESARTPVAV